MFLAEPLTPAIVVMGRNLAAQIVLVPEGGSIGGRLQVRTGLRMRWILGASFAHAHALDSPTFW